MAEGNFPPPDDLAGPTIPDSPAVPAVSGYQDVTAHQPQSTRSWSGPPPPMEEEDELIGTTLCDTYTINRVLGEGGMGRVYEAQHTRIASKRFAIKTLHPEFLRQRDVIQRFRREAEAAASISSPHVVGVYDVDKIPDGRPFLVAELLDGQELGDVLQAQGKLPIGTAVGIVRQICQALAAAHEQGIVHRDIKPENVFLTGNPAEPLAKVLDFGISRLDDESGKSLTRTGMIMGTPAYMPPEQARGERVDHRADIYAAGAILYTAITGRVLFERDDPAATLVAVLTQEPERPRAIDATIPDHLEFVMQKALARDPEERFQSVTEFYDALAPFDPKESAHPTLQAGPATLATTGQGSQVQDARALLALVVVAGLATLVIGLITAVGAILRLGGVSLSTMEMTLLSLGGLAALITPLVLIARHVRATAWNNTLKTLTMLSQVRDPLLAGGCTYGLSTLLVRLVEGVFRSDTVGDHWPGWDIVLFVASVAVAVVLGAWQRRSRSGGGGKGGTPAPPRLLPVVIAVGTALGVAVMVIAALRSPTGALIEVAGAEGTTGTPGKTSGKAGKGDSRDRATTEELEIAKGSGIETLSALAKRFPADPAVLKELMLAQAAHPKSMPDALDTLKQLVDASPEARRNPDVKRTLETAVTQGGDHAERAFGLLAKSLGSAGPDMLYDLGNKQKGHRKRTDELLADPKVLDKATPALRIALELRAAKGCQGKYALLARAATDGDHRCVALLRPLTIGRKRGCGLLGLGACPARCRAQAAKMRQTIQAIESRSK
ncbi:MAG: serine/threonine protein kinase [Deltaproteobacteria bacterium]|nr:serine/threonine protein kinase [Deltaproteobacteria bacterium]